MKLIELTTKDLKPEEIDLLFNSVGGRSRGQEKWKEILSKSSFVYSVYDKEKMVGIGRIVEDGYMCMLYDIVVHKDYQGMGIGKMIVNNLLAFTGDKNYSSIRLFVSPENKFFLIPFYEKFGFELFETGMKFKNKKLKYR